MVLEVGRAFGIYRTCAATLVVEVSGVGASVLPWIALRHSICRLEVLDRERPTSLAHRPDERAVGEGGLGHHHAFWNTPSIGRRLGLGGITAAGEKLEQHNERRPISRMHGPRKVSRRSSLVNTSFCGGAPPSRSPPRLA